MAKTSKPKPVKNKEIVFSSDLTEIICSKIKQVKIELEEEIGEKITNEKFGARYGWNVNYVKGILSRNFAPSHDALAKFAQKENLSIDWLYGLVPDKKPLRHKKNVGKLK